MKAFLLKRLALPLALLLPPLHAWAEKTADPASELKPAHRFLQEQNYGKAYGAYLRHAGRNGLAQFMLGLMHRNGWGRAQDAAGACAWFEKAAGHHVPAAEHLWADCLAQGMGRNIDDAKAQYWYAQAAAHGHLLSNCNLAEYHLQGRGVPRDPARGLALCTQVAELPSPPAMMWLARHYDEGRDIPQDLAAARRWYGRAAQRGLAEAQYRVGMMLAQGEGGEPDLQQALHWLESAASQGHAPAYLPTAVLYANAPVQEATGMLAPEHLAKVYLWTSAARARSTDAQQQAAIRRIDELVAQVMPDTWRPDLDRKVAEHLAKFPADAPPRPQAQAR